MESLEHSKIDHATYKAWELRVYLWCIQFTLYKHGLYKNLIPCCCWLANWFGGWLAQLETTHCAIAAASHLFSSGEQLKCRCSIYIVIFCTNRHKHTQLLYDTFSSLLSHFVDCGKNFDDLLTMVMRSNRWDCLLCVFFSFTPKISGFNEHFNADNTQYLLVMTERSTSLYGMVEHSFFTLESQ